MATIIQLLNIENIIEDNKIIQQRDILQKKIILYELCDKITEGINYVILQDQPFVIKCIFEKLKTLLTNIIEYISRQTTIEKLNIEEYIYVLGSIVNIIFEIELHIIHKKMQYGDILTECIKRIKEKNNLVYINAEILTNIFYGVIPDNVVLAERNEIELFIHFNCYL